MICSKDGDDESILGCSFCRKCDLILSHSFPLNRAVVPLVSYSVHLLKQCWAWHLSCSLVETMQCVVVNAQVVNIINPNIYCIVLLFLGHSSQEFKAYVNFELTHYISCM